MVVELALCRPDGNSSANPSSCEHRTVAKDGRIVCSKIAEGDNEVSPNVCRACPFKAINCGHLRFSLRQTSPSPIIVRFNGHTEVWDDKPPELQFDRAACVARVIPIEQPGSCAECALREPMRAPSEATTPRIRRMGSPGRVVPFPERKVAAAG